MMNSENNYKLVVLTPINSRDGISEYSRNLYSNFSQVEYLANKDIVATLEPDTPNIHRVWEWGTKSAENMVSFLDTRQPYVLHIQYHPAFFSLEVLQELLLNLPPNIKTFITPHIVKAPGFDLADGKLQLDLAEKIYVHKQSDVDRLIDKGFKNVELYTHPYWEYPVQNTKNLRKQLELTKSDPIVVTHGLISNHKGLLEVASALPLLKKEYPNLMWLAVNALNPNNANSEQTLVALEELLVTNNLQDNVILITDFISEPELITLIQSADLGLLLYTEMGESSSGAVRKFIAAGTPVIVTDIPWMKEFSDEVFKISDTQPSTIASGVNSLLNDKGLRERVVSAARSKSKKYGWKSMATRLSKDYSDSTASKI